MKEQLAGYFARRDVDGAKAYFLERRKERPDVLMEASDVTGELRLCMQVIATAGMGADTLRDEPFRTRKSFQRADADV